MTCYYKGEGWQVTDTILRTPRKTFAMKKLDAVSLKRSFFLLLAVPSGGALLLTAFWWRYLYPGEIGFMIALSVAALIVSFQFGCLKVEAVSLSDDEGGTVYGRFSQLAAVRDAIERAMQDRAKCSEDGGHDAKDL